MRPTMVREIAKGDVRNFKKLLYLVEVVCPDETSPMVKTYCMKREEIEPFLKKQEVKGRYFLSINP